MPSQAPLQDRWHSVIKIVLIYAAFASAWILLSDKAVLLVTADPDEMVRISMFKGWAFVAVTSLLLYFLLNRYWGRYTAALTDQINTLKLIETVADSSSDAIFAKDMDGRYLVFNQAASNFVGKPAKAVIGRDDLAIFPGSRRKNCSPPIAGSSPRASSKPFLNNSTRRPAARPFMSPRGRSAMARAASSAPSAFPAM